MNHTERIEQVKGEVKDWLITKEKVEDWLFTSAELNLNIQSKAYKEHLDMVKNLCKDVFPELYEILFNNSDKDLIFDVPGLSLDKYGFKVVYYNPDSLSGGQIVEGVVLQEDIIRVMEGDSLCEVISNHKQWLSDIDETVFFNTIFELLRYKDFNLFIGDGAECIINYPYESKWSDIYANHADETETAIVGYQAKDADEPPVTIAVIIHDTKDVEYKDEDAKTDLQAQKVIQQTLREIKGTPLSVLHTGLYDKNNKEAKPGDILMMRYGGKILVEEFGSRITGAFTYRPIGATNPNSSYLLSDLKSEEIEIIENGDCGVVTESISDVTQEKKPSNRNVYNVVVTRYGYASIAAESENEALEIAKNLATDMYDWSDFDEPRVVDE